MTVWHASTPGPGTHHTTNTRAATSLLHCTRLHSPYSNRHDSIDTDALTPFQALGLAFPPSPAQRPAPVLAFSPSPRQMQRHTYYTRPPENPPSSPMSLSPLVWSPIHTPLQRQCPPPGPQAAGTRSNRPHTLIDIATRGCHPCRPRAATRQQRYTPAAVPPRGVWTPQPQPLGPTRPPHATGREHGGGYRSPRLTTCT